jgi:hypothetical protein
MLDKMIKKQQKKLDHLVKDELNREKFQRKVIKGKHLKKMSNREYRSEKYSNIVDLKEDIKNQKEYEKLLQDPTMQKELDFYVSSFDSKKKEILPYLRANYFDPEEEKKLF